MLWGVVGKLPLADPGAIPSSVSDGQLSLQSTVNLIVGWCGQFLFFVVPPQFSSVVGSGQKIKF